MYNNVMFAAINTLTFEQNIKFALSCINRVKPLTKLFLYSNLHGLKYLEKIVSVNDIETSINGILDNLMNNRTNILKNNARKNMAFLEKLLLDDDIDATLEKQIFFNYIVIIMHTLEYIVDNDCKSIYWCSNAVIEIQDRIKHKECEKNNSQWTDKEISTYVDAEIDKEIEKELEIIQIIKNGNEELFEQCIKENILEYKM
jgi:hypothetical protein